MCDCETPVQIAKSAVAKGEDGRDIAVPAVRMLEKLNLNSNMQLMRYAFKEGMVS